MKLLIISNMSHYTQDGCIVGWGPTVQEINHLSNLFDEVFHIGCLHPGTAPASSLPYDSPKIHFVPVPAAGGARLRDKAQILFLAPHYVRIIRREMRDADVIHVRCPANISLIAILLLALSSKAARRWIKYAGNWKPQQGEPWSYRFQRWLLRHGFHRGVVTVNGNWQNEPEFINSFPNPCLTSEELVRAKEIVSKKRLSDPIRLVYAGRVDDEKGVGRCLRILCVLRKNNVAALLDVVGDGPKRGIFVNMAQSLGIAEAVRFHGWLPRPQLPFIYAEGHVLLFPSVSSEGWPKVLSEAMAYGMVPVASNISSIPHYFEMYHCGVALSPDDIEGFAAAITSYRNDPEKWREQSINGMKAAHFFSYDTYLVKVAELLQLNPQEPVSFSNEVVAARK